MQKLSLSPLQLKPGAGPAFASAGPTPHLQPSRSAVQGRVCRTLPSSEGCTAAGSTRWVPCGQKGKEASTTLAGELSRRAVLGLTEGGAVTAKREQTALITPNTLTPQR